MIPLIAVWFKLTEAFTGPCACGEVVTGEIAGGVVMKAGSPALEELTAVRMHATAMNLAAETSFRQKRARPSRSICGSVDGSMANLAIFIMLVFWIRTVFDSLGSAFVPINGA